jgi:F-type H+-transporting ATPase subunit a
MRPLRYAWIALAALIAAPALAQEPAHDEEHFDAVHHTADGNYLDFSPIGKIELPRLFIVRGEGGIGVDAFASTTAAMASGRYHAVSHDEPEHAEEDLTVDPGEHAAEEAAGAPHPSEGEASDGREAGAQVEAEDHAAAGEHEVDPLAATLEPVDGEILVDLSITRHVVFLFAAMGLLALLLVPMGRRYRSGVGRTSAPRGLLQNMLETLVVYIRDEVAKPNLGPKYEKYLPYLLTAFFVILTANLLGLVPFGATATSNIAVTAVLALFTFVITQLSGTRDYWMHIFSPPGVPVFVKPILIPIEILGLFTKPFALAIRLFANMTAGHLVILNFIGLIFIIRGLFGDAAGWGTSVPAVAMSVFIYALELLVALIQAYVFTVLSALFIGMASAEHEHDHNHTHEHDITAHDRAVSESTPLISGTRLHPDQERTVGTEAAISPF